MNPPEQEQRTLASVPWRCALAAGLAAVGCSAPLDPWAAAESRDTAAAYRTFVQRYPDSPQVPEARARLARLEAAVAWETLRGSDDEAAFEDLLARYPGSPHAGEAHARLAVLRAARNFAAAEERDEAGAYEAFLAEHPEAEEVTAARHRLSELRRLARERELAAREWERISGLDDSAEYDHFLRTHPISEYAVEASRRLVAATRPEEHLGPGWLDQITEARHGNELVLAFVGVRASEWEVLGQPISYALVKTAPAELVRVTRFGVFDRHSPRDLASETLLRYFEPGAVCELYLSPEDAVEEEEDAHRLLRSWVVDIVHLMRARPELPSASVWNTACICFGPGAGAGLRQWFVRGLAGSERWISALGGQRADERRVALLALAALDHPRVGELAEPLLEDPVPSVREAALAVRGSADPAPAEPLRSARAGLLSGDTERRLEAVRTLTPLDGERVLDLLKEAAQDLDPVVSLAALDALAGRSGVALVRALLYAEGHRDSAVRTRAAELLERPVAERVGELREALEEPALAAHGLRLVEVLEHLAWTPESSSERSWLALLRGELDELADAELAREPLLLARYSSDPEVRAQALRGLERLGEGADATAAEERKEPDDLEEPEEPGGADPRRWVVLRREGTGKRFGAAVLPDLLEVARTGREADRIWAAAELAAVPDERAVAQLAELAEVGAAALREAAVKALEVSDSAAAGPALVGLLHDSEGSEVRAAAAGALAERGERSAVEPLVERLRGSFPLEECRAVRDALAQLGWCPDDDADWARWFLVEEDWERMAAATDADLRAALATEPERVRRETWIEIHGARLLAGRAESAGHLLWELRHWEHGGCAVRALERGGWTPADVEEEILAAAARRDLQTLRERFDEALDVLLGEVASGHPERLDNGIHHLLAIGREDALDELTAQLHQRGTVDMAETYLNAGNDVLAQAAQQWAEEHGYRVSRGAGEVEARWGGYR